MEFLDYIKIANQHVSPDGAELFPIAITTNFTDDALIKVMKGVCSSQGLLADLYQTPYKQYAFKLKQADSDLCQFQSRVSFFFFDANAFLPSEFSQNPDFFSELLVDLKAYAQNSSGLVVLSGFLLPYHGPNAGGVFGGELFNKMVEFNSQMRQLADELTNVQFFDTNAVSSRLGEALVYDLRGLHAFDCPFSNTFFTLLAEYWFAYIRALAGKSKKCIVVDLDNTLWGGVVGETGPLGVELGTTYPGSAFQNFQRALLGFYNRGVLLAINSKNNAADVDAVFDQNSDMVLKKEHFAVIKANWQDKDKNILEIAEELNINTDSFIFLDDDPVNRELVRMKFPEVYVPEFSLPPENYAAVLYSLPLFSPMTITDEDKERGKRYSDESRRKQLLVKTKDISEFIAGLNISIHFAINDCLQIPRISQLTLKTNQFNLTTRRYTEKDIEDKMIDGQVFGGQVCDKFGDYGLTIVAIIKRTSPKSGKLDVFLQSCRVMGRGVEFRFLDAVLGQLAADGLENLEAEFIPTAKNDPAAEFLPAFGFKLTHQNDAGASTYQLDLNNYQPSEKVNQSIIINITA
jgi:FkbH-like protein